VTCVGRRVGVLFPAASRIPILLIDAPTDVLTADTRPVLGVDSCSASSQPRTPSGTLISPAAAQGEKP
jgi:hypothetical protein